MIKFLQKIGRSLMVPVAVLPAGAILMGIGYWLDPTGWGANSATSAFLIKSGSSIIDNMSVLFAIGIAYGLSKDKDGAAALAGFIGFTVITTLLSPATVEQIGLIELTEINRLAFSKINNQFIGIISGILASSIYNRFYQVELSNALTFFSGKRLVPILTATLGIVLSFILMYIWPIIFSALVSFGESITEMGSVGAGIYGFLNRLLIPVGLHHALNAVFWFDLAGINDLGNFWQGAKGIEDGVAVVGETGRYMGGFFPIMMFGLPATCLAFYHTAKPENKAMVASIMGAGALASFFTGVTEPIEFAFMFVAPVLYFIHAVLTGVSLFIASSMQWTAGFGFSAGLIDLTLASQNPVANNCYMLILLGLIMSVIYYSIFIFIIKIADLKTIGREDREQHQSTNSISSSHTETAYNLLQIIGKENLTYVDNCTTRLRLEVKDTSLINKDKLKKYALEVVIQSKTSIQIIIGTHVEFIALELKKLHET